MDPASSLPDEVPSTITAKTWYEHLSTEELRFQNYQSGLMRAPKAAAAAAPTAPAVATAPAITTAPATATAQAIATAPPSSSTAGWDNAAAGGAGSASSPHATLLEIKYPTTWLRMNSCSKSVSDWQVLLLLAP
jgi:hypothetical protein